MTRSLAFSAVGAEFLFLVLAASACLAVRAGPRQGSRRQQLASWPKRPTNAPYDFRLLC